MKGSFLPQVRRGYELELGRLSDCQWKRISERLKLAECSLGDAERRVEIYVMLRRMNTHAFIGLEEVVAVQQLHFSFSDRFNFSATGKQIAQFASLYGSRAAIYRWGNSIGFPLRMEREYKDEGLEHWLIRIAIAALKVTNQKQKLIKRDDNGRFA